MGWFVGNGWRVRCLFYVNTATGEKSGDMLVEARLTTTTQEEED